MVTVAALGDNFVFPELFEQALQDSTNAPLVFQKHTFPWPQVPFGQVGNVNEASGTEEDVIEAIRDAEIVMTQLAPFTKKVFENSPSLRMVSVCRGGPVNVDLEAATKAGVLVTYAPGRNAQAAAEFTVGMMLAAMRRIGDGNTALHRGKWRGEYYSYPSAGMELSGNTVGIIGFGAIGRIVAGIVHAFGAQVLIHDPYLAPDVSIPEGMSVVDLADLMRMSRVVSIHARLTEESRHMLNRANLTLLPKGAVLVNTARGGLLDYGVLPELLDNGQLGALALDVFDEEPPPASWPLLGRDNVVLTPHLAGATKQTAERAATIIANDIARFIDGDAPHHVANTDVLVQLNLTA